jgi:hypothetical protein
VVTPKAGAWGCVLFLGAAHRWWIGFRVPGSAPLERSVGCARIVEAGSPSAPLLFSFHCQALRV